MLLNAFKTIILGLAIAAFLNGALVPWAQASQAPCPAGAMGMDCAARCDQTRMSNHHQGTLKSMPCKAMTHCPMLVGCLGAFVGVSVTPQLLAEPMAYGTISYWSDQLFFSGVLQKPELLPPRILA